MQTFHLSASNRDSLWISLITYSNYDLYEILAFGRSQRKEKNTSDKNLKSKKFGENVTAKHSLENILARKQEMCKIINGNLKTDNIENERLHNFTSTSFSNMLNEFLRKNGVI